MVRRRRASRARAPLLQKTASAIVAPFSGTVFLVTLGKQSPLGNLLEALHIERAHRVGWVASGPRRRPRTIVCKLRDFKQKEQILKVTRRIKPVGLYVNEDLAKETLDKRPG